MSSQDSRNGKSPQLSPGWKCSVGIPASHGASPCPSGHRAHRVVRRSHVSIWGGIFPVARACWCGSSACGSLVSWCQHLSLLWGLLFAGWAGSGLPWQLLRKPCSALLPRPAPGAVECEAWSFDGALTEPPSCPVSIHIGLQATCTHVSVLRTLGRGGSVWPHVGVGLTSTCISSLYSSQARAFMPALRPL